MINILHANGFFESKNDVIKLKTSINSLQFSDTEFGKEILDFNMINPDLAVPFSKFLNINAEIVEEKSGIFRKPENIIHFEGFDSVDEWLFAVALEQTTFNVYKHLSGAKTALDGFNFNYRNLFEWDYTSNILLEENDCVFFRPWLFHSFSTGIIHMYRIKNVQI